MTQLMYCRLQVTHPKLAAVLDGLTDLIVTADHKPGSELTVECNYRDLVFHVKHGRTGQGYNVLAEISKEGQQMLRYNLDTHFRFSIVF